MKAFRHKTVREFLDRAGPWLRQAEAENNLIVGIGSMLAAHPERFDPEPYLVTVEDGGQIAGAALMTSPRKLLLSQAPAAAVEIVARSLEAAGAPVPGVVGLSREADVFSRWWSRATGKSRRLAMRHTLYQCDRVVFPAASPGHLRPASSEELPLLTAWYREFCREAGVTDEPNHQQTLEGFVADGQCHVWHHDRPVSMAVCVGETDRGMRVGIVYTPPNLRRRGYATSCVAALTQLLLDGGKTYCFLFADLANSTSNTIYRRIGYRPVCDCAEWYFDS
jgi:predicted GNAT family acetyltransferase